MTLDQGDLPQVENQDRIATDIHPDTDPKRLTFSTNIDLTIGKENNHNLRETLGKDTLSPDVTTAIAKTTADIVEKYEIDQTRYTKGVMHRIIAIRMRGENIPQPISEYTNTLYQHFQTGTPLEVSGIQLNSRDTAAIIAGTTRALFLNDDMHTVDYQRRTEFQEGLRFNLQEVLSREDNDSTKRQAEAVLQCFGPRQ